jgi:hypothetical protein
MFQVKVFDRKTDEVIMETDSFDTLAEGADYLRSVGHGENYYALMFRLEVQEVG